MISSKKGQVVPILNQNKSTTKKKLNPKKLMQYSSLNEQTNSLNSKLNPTEALSDVVTVSKIPHKPGIRVNKARENVIPLSKTKSDGLIKGKVEAMFPLKKCLQEKGLSKTDQIQFEEPPSSVKAKSNVKPTPR